MTQPQILAFLILGGMMILFIWGRLRYDVVAMLALVASLVAGTVRPDEAFRGFSDDIVIIVGSALVVSAGIARSGVVEVALQWVGRRVTSLRWQLTVLVGSVTLLSAIVKNIGALAMLMPAAFGMAKRSGASPSVFLMPMAFASLLGGLITLVGTSPNIIVSRVREQMTGTPFGMFDYAPVGLGLSLVGLIFLRFGYRLLPSDRRAAARGLGEAVFVSDYNTEARVLETSRAAGVTVSDFLSDIDGALAVTGIIRDGKRRATVLPDTKILVDDLLLLRGAPDALEAAITRGRLALARQEAGRVSAGVALVETVVVPESLLVGQSAGGMALHDRHGLNLIAISRAGHRMSERLGDTSIAAGDVLLVQGPEAEMPEQMRALGLLPLAQRKLGLGSVRKALLPLLILGSAMALTATGAVPVAVAFFGAATAMIASGALPAREATEAVEWPILVMLGALIPVSEALQTTGATELIGTLLSDIATGLPVWGALTLIMVAAMAVTPFLNNAATVLVMAPIAATFATDLGYRPEAFLMAVAVGAGSDFLTPIGHQSNTLVLGPGGYRFGDYARLGAPLSVLVVLVGVPLILAVWPV